MMNRNARAAILTSLGAGPDDLKPLLEYTSNHFQPDQVHWPIRLPLDPEPHVPIWREYANQVRRDGSVATLAHVFPQLQFPIRSGISSAPTYQAATRRGIPPSPDAELRLPLVRPDAVEIVLHPTAAGAIPLIIVRHRDDFVTLVRAFTKRNEPAPIPDSQGACVVAGYNNWDRVRRHRLAWEAAGSPGSWDEEFQRLAARKPLYQDRFIILSDGPYSAVPASAMGMAETPWRETSLIIRREHECAHYCTKRIFGSMRNHAHDEILADFAGIAAATGRYEAEWFLRFMGLEAYPALRPTGRMWNYRGDPALPDGAFTVLQTLVVRAAWALERCNATDGGHLRDLRARTMIFLALARLTLEELASDAGVELIDEVHDMVSQQVEWQPEARRSGLNEAAIRE